MLADRSQPSPHAAGMLGRIQSQVADHLPASAETSDLAQRERNARAVIGPTPGWVCSRWATRSCSAASRTADPAYRLFGPRWSSKKQQLFPPLGGPSLKGNSSSRFLPCRSRACAFSCTPWFRPRCCSWFFTCRLIPTSLCRWISNCRASRCAGLGTQDPRKPILQQQLQEQLGSSPVGLLLAHLSGLDLARISQPQPVA